MGTHITLNENKGSRRGITYECEEQLYSLRVAVLRHPCKMRVQENTMRNIDSLAALGATESTITRTVEPMADDL